ncbi:MAG TPA: DNA translocase FtsK [Pirellulaceae bacterium]|jgi:S-DNA-T family DNA segregation ATPase FtsK/SpoIIIE|nr:DNA translocase FtsK [Pirellulaceae bacterium]
MFDERKVRLDLLAIALLAFTVFLTLALFSYSPADRFEPLELGGRTLYAQDLARFPASAEITNVCGYWGAVASDFLISTLGAGAYLLIFSLAAGCAQLFRRQTISVPLVRASGVTLAAASISSLVALLKPDLLPFPPVGSGGYLGAWLNVYLVDHFAAAGAFVLSAGGLVAGMLLSTDYVLLVLTFVFCRQVARGGLAAYLASKKVKIPKMRLNRERAAALPAGLALASAGSPVEGGLLASQATAARGGEEFEEDEDDLSLGGKPSKRAGYDDLARPKIVPTMAAKEADPVASRALSNPASPLAAAAKSLTELAKNVAAQAPDGNGADSAMPAMPPDARRDAEDPAAKKGRLAPKPHLKLKPPEPADERTQVMSELDEADRKEESREFALPSLDLLLPPESLVNPDQEEEVRMKAEILEQTLGEFGFQVKVVAVETGPVIAQYEVKLEAGLRLSKITGLSEDLAIALRVPSVRIVAPLPGKNTVGVEIPNEHRRIVRLREVIDGTRHKAKKMHIPIFLGTGVAGDPIVVDLAKTPHLLIAGSTGTGKSVCLNAIIASILMTRRPDEVRMLLLDPKKVELSPYASLPHLMHPVVTETREKAEPILAWAVDKMEERYTLLARAGVRHVSLYNQLGEDELMRRLKPEDDDERELIPRHLPFIVIVLDEFADMMQEDKAKGKEIESHIIRLAQKSRAVGIHLILATQRPTVDVITGLIKSNLPSRISFKVSSRTDSRVVLDEMGAEKLLGDGDMLFLSPGQSGLQRGQGTYLSDEEIQRIISFVSQGEQRFVEELMNLKVESDEEGPSNGPITIRKRDELYESAIEIVVRERRGSVSLLQRSLGIGYGRAARLIDFMAEDGIVGAYSGQQARDVMISISDWEKMQGIESGEDELSHVDSEEEDDDEELASSAAGQRRFDRSSGPAAPEPKRLLSNARDRVPADEFED